MPISRESGRPLSFEYTATAADDGKPIGIALAGDANADLVTLEIVGQSGPIDPSQSTASITHTDEALSFAMVGSATTITVQARNTDGSKRTIGGNTVTGSVSGSNTATLTFTDNNNGTYTASYIPSARGNDTITIQIDGIAIQGSPFTYQVKSGTLLKVMTFNVENRLRHATYGPKIVEAIQAAGADVVGVNETGSQESLDALKTALGWNYGLYDSGRSSAGIVSKYPMQESASGQYGSIARIRLPSKQDFWHLCTHVGLQANWSVYYLPYSANSGNYTEQQLIELGSQNWDEDQWNAGHGTDIHVSIQRITTALNPALTSGNPVFLTGDFNEPSYLDWTQAAANAGVRPMKVEMPFSKRVEALGFTDSFRDVRPNEVTDWGHTWTPLSDSIHDRIDFVHYQGQGISCVKSQVVGESSAKADIVITPWPSDHRAVVSTFFIDADTDGDGLSDTYEMEEFGNLTSANGTGDHDGDGVNNLDEQLFGTSSNDASDFPVLTISIPPNNVGAAILNFKLSKWALDHGIICERSSELNGWETVWSYKADPNLQSPLIQATANSATTWNITLTDTAAGTDTKAHVFYRLRTGE